MSDNMSEAANKLHHISLRIIGGFMEFVNGTPISFVPANYPGRLEVRDIIDLALFLRAEVTALTRILIETKTISAEKLTKIMIEEYDFVTKAKEEQYKIESTDDGLIINKESK